MDGLLPALLHPIVASWRRASDASWRRLPRPVGDPIAHSIGPNPLRLLLVGGGIAVGYGTMSHDLALAGQIARAISARTERGVSVDIRAGANEQLSGASRLLSGLDLARFDGILATFGGAESATFLSPARWRRHLVTFLDFVEQHAPEGIPVFIGGIPLIDGIPGVWGRKARRRALILNEVSHQVCDPRDNCYAVALDSIDPKLEVTMNREIYGAWAQSLAPPVAKVLSRAGARSVNDRTERVDEGARQTAVDELNVDSDDSLGPLLASARLLFQVSGARVDVIDGGRRRVVAADGMSRLDSSREESISNIAIGMPGLLCIRDTTLDDRLAPDHWNDGGVPVRFYAGFPIEAPDGHRVGTLCIVDSQPRGFSAADEALLRDLTLQAQAHIWHRT